MLVIFYAQGGFGQHLDVVNYWELGTINKLKFAEKIPSPNHDINL